MKTCLFLFSIVLSLGLFAQTPAPKAGPVKPKTLPEMLKSAHTTVSAKRDARYGWDVSLKLASRVADDSISHFEVLRADSSIYYATIMFSEYQVVEKGQVLKRFMEITGDSIAPTDRFAPVGTFKDLYPKDALGTGKASIMFLDAIVPNSTVPGYFLPDFEATSGVFHIGDTIQLVDEIGRTCTGKIEVLESSYDGMSGSINAPIFHAIPAFTVPNKYVVFLVYSKLSGEDVGANIAVTKIH